MIRIERIMKYIYKYLTFNQFVDLVESKRLYLTRVSEWDDVYEAVELRHLVSNGMRKGPPQWVPEMLGEDLMKALDQSMFDSYYAQSWTWSEEESDAMWRIYSPNNDGVRLKMNVDKIYNAMKCSLLQLDSNIKIFHNKVKYQNTNIGSIEVKRKAFFHEKEYRFWCIAQWNAWNKPPAKPFLNDLEGFRHYLIDCHINAKKTIYYTVENSLIDEVVLDPRAPRYHEETFFNYCNNRGFKDKIFKKSTLYTEL